MQITTAQLHQISIFSGLESHQLVQLQPHSAVKNYLQGEIVLPEGDRLPAKLFSVLTGVVQIKKTALTGKETILRTLATGEMFAAPSLFGDGIAPATAIAIQDCQILTIARSALLEMMQQNPELALRIIATLTERLHHLHNTVHGLASERAIVRLARLIQTAAVQGGTQVSKSGLCLQTQLPYYQIARSIGITYEECVRLFKQLKSIVAYRRGGKILLLDQVKLGAIASGEPEMHD
jgi:CRP/FNR family transcriptional regulator, cyclic AMP receptor protein